MYYHLVPAVLEGRSIEKGQCLFPSNCLKLISWVPVTENQRREEAHQFIAHTFMGHRTFMRKRLCMKQGQRQHLLKAVAFIWACQCPSGQNQNVVSLLLFSIRLLSWLLLFCSHPGLQKQHFVDNYPLKRLYFILVIHLCVRMCIRSVRTGVTGTMSYTKLHKH